MCMHYYTCIQVNLYKHITYISYFIHTHVQTLGGTYNPSITHFRILSRNQTTQTAFVNLYEYAVVGVAEDIYMYMIYMYIYTYVRTYVPLRPGARV